MLRLSAGVQRAQNAGEEDAVPTVLLRQVLQYPEPRLMSAEQEQPVKYIEEF